jgi:lysophospholipase L1-like esterase
VSDGERLAVRYVALGDSYTIGTATRTRAERWPDQLVARLSTSSPTLALIENLGVNGFTSRDLIEVELPHLVSLEPGFVTVLVGVNDVVQGVVEATYRENMSIILDELLSRLPPSRLLVVTTPDYTITPRGGDFGDPTRQALEIRRFNAAVVELAAERGIAVADIHDLWLEAATDRSLVADDGLHPSGAQYARWVDRIAPVVEDLLRS